MGGGSACREGATSNGEAFGISFARERAQVVVVDRDEEAAVQTVKQIESAGVEAIKVHADVSSHADVKVAVAAALKRFGRINIPYNNFGIEVRGGVVDMSEEAWDRVDDVKLKSILLACKEFVPLMEDLGGGAVIKVSSTASLRWSAVEYISYSTSKAALNHHTRVMARQYAPKKIRCNAILLGMIDTPHIRLLYKDKSSEEFEKILPERNGRCPMGRQGTSWEIASAAVFLASVEASYVNGLLLPVDGALSC